MSTLERDSDAISKAKSKKARPRRRSPPRSTLVKIVEYFQKRWKMLAVTIPIIAGAVSGLVYLGNTYKDLKLPIPATQAYVENQISEPLQLARMTRLEFLQASLENDYRQLYALEDAMKRNRGGSVEQRERHRNLLQVIEQRKREIEQLGRSQKR